MSLEDNLTKQLRRDEGEVLHAYQDHLGYWTIGIGILIDKRKGGGLRPEESDFIFQNRMRLKAEEVARRIHWFNQLDDARKGVLLNMAFQMGINGLMGFKNTLKMIERGDYEGAAEGMKHSLWYRQTPARAQRLMKQMRTGEWQ